MNFRGAAAEAVESRRVQIGERVELSLLGVELEELQEATQRDVPWTACYGRRLVMRVGLLCFTCFTLGYLRASLIGE